MRKLFPKGLEIVRLSVRSRTSAILCAGDGTCSTTNKRRGITVNIRILVFLLVFPSFASADEKSDQWNVYDFFSELKDKTTSEIALEEDVTSRIKRYMAALLYPVDLSVFARPEKDPKFRATITALQKQMGETTTGILTSGQFDRLHEAARNLDEIGVGVGPGKSIYQSKDGNTVGANGTGVMNDLANPINTNRMLCIKSEGTCEMTGAELNLHDIPLLYLAPPTVFEIKTWTPNRITAISENPCGTATLTVDVDAQDVTIASVPHTDLTFCSKGPASFWKLVDGFPVTWNIYRERYNKARALVYEPAKKFFPERVPAK